MMTDIGLGFKNLTVTVKDPSAVLLSQVSGYVKRGGITAVMGASAAGKSVLLQTLSGRLQDATISGEVKLKGIKIDPKSIANPIAYVPQEDSLIGELTAREVTKNTALFKRDEPQNVLDNDVAMLLDKLGLSKVADGIIGTLIFRGLSGGQKKRVEISSELIASPCILLLDEPTSGLDSAIAYDVLRTVRELVVTSNGMLSVILTIHQPNSKILTLFDHLLIMDHGSSIFFGSILEANNYFSGLGFPCPDGVTPTDYYLKISDTNFSFAADFDFVEGYKQSDLYQTLLYQLGDEKDVEPGSASATIAQLPRFGDNVSGFQKFSTLVYREYALAYRDPTLYYLQFVLIIAFSFFTGAMFFQLPKRLDSNFNIFPGALVWLTLMSSWVHVFKVYHINRNDKRTKHEMANNKYGPFTAFFADWFSTSTLGTLFFPAYLLAYGMMGFPMKAYPFLILNFWVSSMASEAMLALICKFSTDATVSMIFCQLALVILMVFSGGVFLPWKDCPDYWIWLQESSIFTQSSRATILEVLAHMTLDCTLTAPFGACYDPGTGAEYTCIPNTYFDGNMKCEIDPRHVLYVRQGVGSDFSYWWSFGFLCCILIGFKLAVLALTICPWERISHAIRRSFEKQLGFGNEGENPVSYKRVKQVAADGLENADTATEIKSALTFTNLNVIISKKGKETKLIDNVNGIVRAGRVLALMGPSGAGKTTLLNALARRAKYATTTGLVSFAGRRMTSTDLTYVPQFDEVNGALTVEEHIMLVGKLTCVDEEDMAARATKLLNVLGLVSKKDTQVKNLSGGEVKRVSIGIGLISNPYVLFLDEPTTGVDSTAAFSLVDYLVRVAKVTGVAVIMTIHQPSAIVFDMLDDLLLLEGGRTVYAGSIPDASKYFASVGYDNPEAINPADYYLDLAQHPPQQSTDEKPVTWRELFLASEYHTKFDGELQAAIEAREARPVADQPNWFARFLHLFRHFMMYFLRQRGFYVNRLGALIILAVFIGTLYLNLQPRTDTIANYAGAMFFSVLCCMLTAVSSISLFAKDRFEAVDRISNGVYTPGVYVLTQFLASAVYNLLVATEFICIFHWLVNLNPTAECFFYDVLTSWGQLMLMEAVLMTVLEALKNDFLTCSAGMIFIGTNMSFAGFFRRIVDAPAWINWMCYIMPLKWSFDGFVWQIYSTQDFEISSGVSMSGKTVLRRVFDLHDINSWGLWGALLGYVILFRGMQYYLFARQTDNLPAFLGGSSQVESEAAAALSGTGANTAKIAADDLRQAKLSLQRISVVEEKL